MNDKELIKSVNQMCVESLSPEKYELWLQVKSALESVRKNLK